MKTFQHLLRSERNKRELTVKRLAELSNLHDSLISGVEHGDRVIGEISAIKLAQGLGLEGKDQISFILSAMEESKDRLLKLSMDYPVILLNQIPLQLHELGIVANQIHSSEENDKGILLSLKENQRVQIETRIQIHPFNRK